MIQTEADRAAERIRKQNEEVLIKKFMLIAQERATKTMKLRQWALDYVARIGVTNADEATEQAKTLLAFLADELSQETDA